MRQRRLAVASEQAAHGAHGQRRTEVHIPRESARPLVEQLAPVLAPVHPPAVQVKHNDIPLENHKDTAYIGCIFVFLLLLSAKLDGREKDWAKMVQGDYATRIQSLSDKEEPHYLKTQARSPILEDFGLE